MVKSMPIYNDTATHTSINLNTFKIRGYVHQLFNTYDIQTRIQLRNLQKNQLENVLVTSKVGIKL